MGRESCRGILVVVASLFVITGGFSSPSFAWGKRGHEIIASVAARLLEESRGKHFLRGHEFDLGYYANVPDLIWRGMSPEIGKREGPQHYIDWTEDMSRVFGSPKNLPTEFTTFKAKLGDKFVLKEGVAPYRVHGMIERCKKIAANLTFETQGPLLLCIGELSHYTGDLSMPLHVAVNHDGELTHQKGIHVFFESDVVNALDPELKPEVLKEAREAFDKSEVQKMSGDQAIRRLIADSLTHVDELLAIDKAVGRSNMTIVKEKYRPLITQRLAQGAIVTAVVWNEILKNVNHFDENKFYFFEGRPEYVDPGKELQ